MIAIITLQSVDGDCPSNIVVDVDKLKAITVEECLKDYENYENSSEEEKLQFATDDYEDAQKYIGHIEGTLNGGNEDDNPQGWDVLEKAEVELPQTIEWTDVIFYG